jgi:peptide/nickel transport system substrate-binding protein
MGWLMRWLAAAVIIAGLGGVAVAGDVEEPPALRDRVAAGTLPPMAERLPNPPLVVDPREWGGSLGHYGGRLRTLMASARDTRMLVVFGYARLVGYTPEWTLMPDILERLEAEEGRVFTFHLRDGHRWSDGHPFTAEDFRYAWEDVLTNPEMTPFGLPGYLLVDGVPPTFEMLDATTVRYAWQKPNPNLLIALAGPRPEYLYMPAHYLRAFHARYADPEALERLVTEERRRNWVALHYAKGAQYDNDNPDLPTLQPWMLTTPPPASYFRFHRNPYFHRVDPEGRQLPYIDEVVFAVVSPKLIPAKSAAGDSDLQARGLSFDNTAVLKQGEKRNPIEVLLWRSASGAELALYPNLTVTDPVWRQVLRTADVRQALSLAINRHEINQVVYFGLADEGGNTVLPESPLFRPEYASMWTAYDPDKARRLLDGAGLVDRDGDGVRDLPDGRPMDILVETAGENPTETDVLQLIADTWRGIGVALYIKPTQRDLLRNRAVAGNALMTVWKGLENAVPTPQMSPRELAPTSQVQLGWAKWGQHYEAGGRAGEPVDDAAAAELVELYEAWQMTTDDARRAEIWSRMLEIHAEQVFSIGIVRGIPQPVVVNKSLRNVPKDGLYAWQPGAHFGVYGPDTFWFDDKAPR